MSDLVDANQWRTVQRLALQMPESSPARALAKLPRPTVDEFARNAAAYRALFGDPTNSR